MTREEAIQYAQERFDKGMYRLEMGYLNRGLYQITAKEVDFLRVALAALKEQDAAVEAIHSIAKTGKVWMCNYCAHARSIYRGCCNCALEGACEMPYTGFKLRKPQKEEPTHDEA